MPRQSVTTLPSRNNASYARRHSSQRSQQQSSACGACRMRRVRCDLKDLTLTSTGPYPACSNCQERGINCVDEFANVKAVKSLVRGRRLQQIEAVYGKTQDQDDGSTVLGTKRRRSRRLQQIEAIYGKSQDQDDGST